MLRSAGAAAAGGAGALALTAPASAAVDAAAENTVRDEALLVDDQGRQRVLAQTTKPPVIVDGETIPASERGGLDDATYLIFNDENGSEKGGVTAGSNGATLGLDYLNAQAISLGTVIRGSIGASQLVMNQMPDPAIDPLQVTPADAPTRVLLGTDNGGDGSLLFLFDSQGKPRIALQVDGQDVPTIKILDADGNVVAQLPESPPAASAKRGGRLRSGSLLGRLRRR